MHAPSSQHRRVVTKLCGVVAQRNRGPRKRHFALLEEAQGLEYRGIEKTRHCILLLLPRKMRDLKIGWAIMTPLPSRDSTSARQDCFEYSAVNVTANTKPPLLACAFATWIPHLQPTTSSVGILFDCGAHEAIRDVTLSARNTSEVPAALRPPAWTRAAPEGVSVAHGCLWGGVCVTLSRTAKLCVRGTAALFEFVLRAFPPDVEMIAKVDTDTVVYPDAVVQTLSSHAQSHLALGCCHGDDEGRHRRLYYGSFSHTVVMLLQSTADEDSSSRTRLRETRGWRRLEREIAGWNLSATERLTKLPTGVGYATGAFYAVSRAALKHSVEHRCHERVAELHCKGWGGRTEPTACEWNVGHEDLVTGMCMHLAEASTFTTAFGNACVDAAGHHRCTYSLISHPFKAPHGNPRKDTRSARAHGLQTPAIRTDIYLCACCAFIGVAHVPALAHALLVC